MNRISCPVCGCQRFEGWPRRLMEGKVRGRCAKCGETYRRPGQTVVPPSGWILLMGLAILAVAACMDGGVVGLEKCNF